MAELIDYRTIVVGTDGSELAEPTVARAAWLAKHDDAALIVVCAWSSIPRLADAKQMVGNPDTMLGQVRGREAAQRALEAAVGVAKKQGVAVTAALLVDGDADTALLETAVRRDADLIVMGAAHSVSLATRLLGDTASAVVKNAPCEVLIVRPPRGDAHEEFEVPES